MSRKMISIKSSKGYNYYIYDPQGGRMDKYKFGVFSGSFDGKVGTASSLSDAIELARALAGGSNQEVEIEDYS